METILHCLVNSLDGERDQGVRKGLGDTLGKWVQEWVARGRDVPFFLPFLLKLATSRDPIHRLTAFQLMASHTSLLFTLGFNLACSPPVTEAPSTSNNHLRASDIAHLVSQGLEDSYLQVRLLALKTAAALLDSPDFTALIQPAESATSKTSSPDVGPKLVRQACQILPTLPPSQFTQATESLMEMVETVPRLFEGCLEELHGYLLEVYAPSRAKFESNTTNDQFPEILKWQPISMAEPPDKASVNVLDDEECRASALELLLTLIEAADLDPLVRLLHSDQGRTIKALLGQMWVALDTSPEQTQEEQLQEWLEMNDLDEINQNYPNEPEDALLRYFNAFREYRPEPLMASSKLTFTQLQKSDELIIPHQRSFSAQSQVSFSYLHGSPDTQESWRSQH